MSVQYVQGSDDGTHKRTPQVQGAGTKGRALVPVRIGRVLAVLLHTVGICGMVDPSSPRFGSVETQLLQTLAAIEDLDAIGMLPNG